MNGTRRERVFLLGSGAVLLVALVVGIAMLLRARSIWSEERSDEEHAQLLARRDELRGKVAELTARNALTAAPREHASLEALRDALRTAARRYQEDPLEGNPDHAPFGCVALELSSPDEGIRVWTSGPLDADDRAWCLLTISAAGADGGTRHVFGEHRLFGVAWRAFLVEGQAHVGALIWMTPRVR